MSGECIGKIFICNAKVYVHIKGLGGARVTHIDVESPVLNNIIVKGETTYCEGKFGGVFLGLKKDMIIKAEEYLHQTYSDDIVKKEDH